MSDARRKAAKKAVFLEKNELRGCTDFTPLAMGMLRAERCNGPI
jgi:hypothetical protein